MRKSVFIFLLSAAIFATAALAQNATADAGQRGMHGPQRAFQQLNLTADQQSQLKQFTQDQRAQMQALRSNASLTPEQRQQQIKQLREANHQKVMGILTPDQQAQFKQMQQQRRGRAMAFNRGRRVGSLQALNLSQQQKDQMKPIFQSTRQQVQTLRGDTSLTPEQRRAKVQEIRQNQQAQLRAILTPEQQQQWQQMRQHHHRGQQNATPPQGF
ncbi:MAG: hypothetical protein ACRD3E_05940 [Terriglobales bacterium]